MADDGVFEPATEKHSAREGLSQQGVALSAKVEALDDGSRQLASLCGLLKAFDRVNFDVHDAGVSHMKIVLASGNPVKARATENGFRRVFPKETFEVVRLSVPSGVSDQPMTDAETLLGATNRIDAVSEAEPSADFWIGIEGGIAEEEIGTGEGISKDDTEMTALAWVVVRSKTGFGKSRTGTFVLPPDVARLVRQGKELGEADDIVFGRSNSKQAEGAVGLLTGGVVDRAQLYEQSVVLALIPFRNRTMY